MASHRLLQRLPNAEPIGIGRLSGHRLSFRKNDSGLSGKCDIEQTNLPADEIIGVIYGISTEEKIILDQIEGLGVGYDEKIVQIQMHSDRDLSAVTYYAIDIDSTMKPYHWYKEHVLRGAIEHGFPRDYIASIEATESINDPHDHRSRVEMSIYD
jgi:gamma-glutamylcyclotransferase